MNLLRWSRPGLCAAATFLVAVLALPAAAAEPVGGTLSAASADLEGEVLQRGLGQFVHAAGGGPDMPAWRIAGARIHTYEVVDEGYKATATLPNGEQYTHYTGRTMRSAGQAPPPVQREVTQGTIVLEEAQPSYTLMAFGGTFSQSAALGQASLGVLSEPAMDHAEGIREATGLEGSPGTTWSNPIANAPHILTTTVTGWSIRLEGTFTVEVMGLSGRLSGQEGAWDVTSGRWEDTATPPGAVQAGTLKEAFLRIDVEDGYLEMADDGGRLQWSGPAVESTVLAGRATLADAAGTLGAPGGPTARVQDPKMDLSPPVLLATRPLGQQMDVGVVPVDGSGQPLALPTMELDPEPVVQGVMAAGTVVALGAAGAWRMAQRRNLPNMAQVEAALESRDYRRAVRTARRILQRRPEAEDARLGLAIALSKSGRHRAVVREIEPYVKTRQPSDGVLFYVLGVAQHELGKEADARTSFREAVQRTPALQADIQKRLGQAPAPAPAPAPSTVPPKGVQPRTDPGGYA